MESIPSSLLEITIRSICLAIIRANVRWRRLSDVRYSLQREINQWSDVPVNLRAAIIDGLNEALREMQRWNEKHSHIFPDECNRHKLNTKHSPSSSSTTKMARPHRQEHLRLFYEFIEWKPHRFHIDDLATARRIIAGPVSDWPLMKFQLASCYAMDDLLEDDWLFDRVRRRTFKQQLDDHPVYHFWLRVLDDREEWHRLYRTDRILVDQRLLQVFRFAMHHGFYELVLRLWPGLTEGQQEAVGFLSWKKICYSAEHRDLTRFLCHRLCQINPLGMARLTWDSFYDKVHKALQGEELTPTQQGDNFRQLETLLENWCDHLRSAMLSRENYRVVTDTFFYNRQEAFSLFLDYLNGQQLGRAREFVDRIYDRTRGKSDAKELRRMVIHRQLTVD